MELVRRHITEGVLANGPTIACFRGYQIRRDNTGEIAVDEFEFGVMDKGAFVIPEMSEVTFDELPGMFVEVCRGNFNNFIWRDLYQQPKRTVSVDVSDGTDSFWRRVIQEASTVGSDPMVLVPYSTFGEEIVAAAQPIVRDDRLVGFSVSHEANMPSGGGTGYMGTIEGVHVYSAQVMSSNAVLCSSRLLRAIDYGVVHGTGDIADFEFVEGEDLRRSRVRLIFAQRTEWAGDVLVEFQITGMETGIS